MVPVEVKYSIIIIMFLFQYRSKILKIEPIFFQDSLFGGLTGENV